MSWRDLKSLQPEPLVEELPLGVFDVTVFGAKCICLVSLFTNDPFPLCFLTGGTTETCALSLWIEGKMTQEEAHAEYAKQVGVANPKK